MLLGCVNIKLQMILSLYESILLKVPENFRLTLYNSIVCYNKILMTLVYTIKITFTSSCELSYIDERPVFIRYLPYRN